MSIGRPLEAAARRLAAKWHTFATNPFPMRTDFDDMLAVGGGPGCPV